MMLPGSKHASLGFSVGSGKGLRVRMNKGEIQSFKSKIKRTVEASKQTKKGKVGHNVVITERKKKEPTGT
jgi:hypothetical protein